MLTTNCSKTASYILEIIGHEHRRWLAALWSQWTLNQEPILTQSGEIVAQPLFSFRTSEAIYACFGTERPRQRVLQRLQDFGIRLLEPGGKIEGDGE